MTSCRHVPWKRSGDLARFSYRSFQQPPYNGFTILRPKFDRWLASKAEEAGALLITSTVVDDLLYKDKQVIGVRCRREEGDLYALL
jgi:electron transfer flavoprotein-quinone oxidoreductase